MNGEVVAIRSFYCEWGMNRIFELMDKGFLVVILVAVGLVGRDFPGSRVGVDIKLRQFVLNADLLKLGLGLNLVPKGYGIIKDAKS